MAYRRPEQIVFGLILVFAALLGLGAAAQMRPARAGGGTAEGYELTWITIDGGGTTTSVGGGYSLNGTIGQFDASEMAGGNTRLSGGFWVPPGYATYLPLVVRASG